MARAKDISFLISLAIVIIMQVIWVGKVEFAILTFFELIISIGVVCLAQTAFETWESYKYFKKQGGV